VSAEISNPFSTGGGGQFFEAKVQASFLLHLLIGGRVPCLLSHNVQSIRLQAKQAGFRTDDVVVSSGAGLGVEHRLLAQIKHHAAIAGSDGEFCEALENAWGDFSNEKAFAKNRDVLALITGPQSDQTLQHVRPLFDWARTSASSAEFVEKVATAKFSSDKKRHYLQVFKDVLATVTGATLTDDILWQFLKHLYLLSYDFDTQASKDEAAVLTILDLARNPNSSLDAQAIWDSLIVQTQEWNKTAGTFTKQQLPERLRSAVLQQRSSAQRDAVSRLREHCGFVLGTINTELAPGIRLSRTATLDVLANAIELARVVVVQGPPGSGKSAMVKLLLEALPNGITSFAFKAQEFNEPHIHRFLTSMGIGLTVAQLRCEFALLPRKVLLVDGAERLFELNNHEAFRHLLQQLSGDKSWTVIITCRESSAQALREHLLAQWGNDVTTVTILLLNAIELEWVSDQAPHLAPLINNQRLTRLLRIPFILSLAWKAFPAGASTEVIADIDERQFKDIVWQGYVERSIQRQAGLPIKRGQCLISVSVARARRMSFFVSPENQDADALNALADDGILIKSNAGGFAPAHDVLEDWAVSRFIAQEFEATVGDPLRFVGVVGTEPAMRRGFRLWLSEALESPSSQHVMDFVLSAFQRADLQAVWCDEIAVAVLQSDNADEFVRRMERLLLDGNKSLYQRLVHVLRTACKGPNESLLRMYGLATFRNHVALGSVFVVPVGNGWRELILLTQRNLASFNLEDASTVLGLLKDWAQGLGQSDPLPPESVAVAEICLKYWNLLTAHNHYASELEEEFLRLLFKLPHAAPDKVEILIRSALANAGRAHHSRIVLEHVTKSIECQPLCAHLPNLVIEVAEKTWRLSPKRSSEYRLHPDLEELFGFEDSVAFNYLPPSSLQGPFTFLLVSHSEVAIDFIVRLANLATLSYSRSRLSREVLIVDMPTLVGSRSLLASARLWALYRGMMSGPPVLGCALMSLEQWLLSEAKQGKDIREIVRKILDSSSSAAIVAVIASVALAYPAAVGDEILPLLGVREFYQWDFERSHQEHAVVSDMGSILGLPARGFDEIYHQERKASDALPHRKSNLEDLTFRLQLTPLRDRIWSILDQFYAALQPEEGQSEPDKKWRIALHRMYARHFKAEEGDEPGKIILTAEEPAADLQQYIEKGSKEFAPIQRRMRLARWGMTRFRREPQSTDSFPDWHDALREAQIIWEEQPSETDETSLGIAGPSFVAASLIRDHYTDLQPTELEWCRKLIIEEVLRKDAERTMETKIAKSSFDGCRPSACVLPLLLKGTVDVRIRSQVEESIAIATTHASEEVRDYAAEGIRTWLWEIDAQLAKACVGGLFEIASIENKIRRDHRRPREFSRESKESAVWAAISDTRVRIVKRESVVALKSLGLDLKTHDWPELLDALSMIRPDTNDTELQSLVMDSLDALLREAAAAEDSRSRNQGSATYEFQYAFARLFARFALARSVEEATKIGDLLSGYVDLCPKLLGVLLESFPPEEDRVRSGLVFWSLWKRVSEPIFEHRLLRGSSRIWGYDELRKLFRMLLFADAKWKEGVKDWAPLTQNKKFVEHAVAVAGNTKAGFGALVSILTSVGQVFLPDAILWLSRPFEKSAGDDVLDDPNAVFDLEVLLRKACYEYGTSIRQRPEQHRAVLVLLDQLVNRGSHTGFRLRDYILAPLSANNSVN